MEVGDRVTYDSRGENQTGTITHVEDRVVRKYTVFWDQDKYYSHVLASEIKPLPLDPKKVIRRYLSYVDIIDPNQTATGPLVDIRRDMRRIVEEG
jgi:hypothetical protein